MTAQIGTKLDTKYFPGYRPGNKSLTANSMRSRLTCAPNGAPSPSIRANTAHRWPHLYAGRRGALWELEEFSDAPEWAESLVEYNKGEFSHYY